ncbi:MAG: hypothetical protein JWO50_313 [Candidatus Kaiserbacteria bacterium]|nr:hypothetical protein [Candidatus Kaiserbacteria bacterium]
MSRIRYRDLRMLEYFIEQPVEHYLVLEATDLPQKFQLIPS